MTDVCRYVRNKVEWLIPYHLQLVFSELLDHVPRGTPPAQADVDDAYERLLSPSRMAYFDYWHQRLTDELGAPDDAQALAILASTARDRRGASIDALRGVLSQHLWEPAERDAQLRYLLDVLESDGYLVRSESRVRFRSPLLRDYWLRRILP